MTKVKTFLFWMLIGLWAALPQSGLAQAANNLGSACSLAFRAPAPTCAKSGACPNTWGSTDIERQFSAHGRIAERFVS